MTNHVNPGEERDEILNSDLFGHLSKEAWAALAVDLLQSSMGEATPAWTMQQEIVKRVDCLYQAGVVRRTLPRSRYPRTGGGAEGEEAP